MTTGMTAMSSERRLEQCGRGQLDRYRHDGQGPVNASGVLSGSWIGRWDGSSDNTIGGTTPAAARNIISGNADAGVYIGVYGLPGSISIGQCCRRQLHRYRHERARPRSPTHTTASSSRPAPPATRSAARQPQPATSSPPTRMPAWRSTTQTTTSSRATLSALM